MKLFVGNLSYDLSEDEIREAFSEFEPLVEFYRPHDRETGKPRGFAFITLADREKGDAAIAALNNKRMGGRELKVNVELGEWALGRRWRDVGPAGDSLSAVGVIVS